ncbi:hypothetical protein FKM82_022732 [Ascaphus truei]
MKWFSLDWALVLWRLFSILSTQCFRSLISLICYALQSTAANTVSTFVKCDVEADVRIDDIFCFLPAAENVTLTLEQRRQMTRRPMGPPRTVY